MIKRESIEELNYLLEHFPAVGILGPRQVGKTTLAKMIAQREDVIYLDLELPEDLAKLSEPSLFFTAYKDHLIILDEIQVKQELFPIMRAHIDKDRRPSRFLILGSATPYLMRASAESLAGRIAYVDLFPLNISEINDIPINDIWLKGGFPLSLLSKTNKVSERWRENFIRTYIEKDLGLLGLPDNPIFLRKFWTMAAHLNAKLSNYSQMGNSLQVSNPTVKEYYEMFVHTFLIFELPPYFKNIKKRIVKSPKYYISDTGILHSLLGIKSFEALLGHPEAGFSWEALVINQIRAVLKPPYSINFYRTHQGAEIDLLITKADEPLISCEIKMSNSPKVSKGMRIAIVDVNTKYNFIITHSSDRYPIAKNIEVIGLKQFISWINMLHTLPI